MAEIAPLKGIIYNRDLAGDPSVLVAPPYDVVNKEEQAFYHRRHENNVLNIDLGAKLPGDQHPYDWHKRAALDFNRWLAQGVLMRHEQPGVYLAETDFTDPTDGLKKTRRGFICLLRLEEFGQSAKVRPHERTFSAHRAERLHHLEHVQAHLSQIFAVYPDEAQDTLDILQRGASGEPLFDFNDPRGHGQRLWPIFDREFIAELTQAMLDKTVYIADGHHRYETSLNYRRLKLDKGIPIPDNSPLNYTLVYLCPIQDPGLAILPAHRLLTNTLTLSQEEMVQSLSRFFEVTTFSFNVVDEKSTRRAFLRTLKEKGDLGINALGLYTHLANTFFLLEKQPGRENGLLSGWPKPLRQLDTVVLTGLVFQEVFGMTDEHLDDASRIAYASQPHEAIRTVNDGAAELAAILNPTRIEQVQAVAETGLVMPRKSTFFFPKVITGMVFNPVNPYEDIERFV